MYMAYVVSMYKSIYAILCIYHNSVINYVLLYPYRIVKSVSAGTDLIIIIKPLIDNQILYISVQ